MFKMFDIIVYKKKYREYIFVASTEYYYTMWNSAI